MFKNYGSRPGDVLNPLTKQIGSGIVNTAIKAEMASEAAIERGDYSYVILSIRKRERSR